MELLQSVSQKVRLLRQFVGGLNTRQRIIGIIFALVFVFVSIVTEGLTFMLACGTGLGVWAATRLRNRPAVYRWDKLIPLLPHLAKDRPLYAVGSLEQTDHGQAADCAVDDDAPTILQDEIAEYIRLMMRDFVMAWYRLLSDDGQFSHNVFIHFKALVKNASGRLSSVDKRHFVCTLLHELRAHVDIYRRLQTSRSRLVKRSNHSVVSIYETFAILHPAVQNAESVKSYLSQMSNCLILALLPSDVISCSTLVLLLQDFLMSNVLQPLVELVSDPDFVNEIFILLLTDEPLLHQPQSKSSSSDGKNGGKPVCEDGLEVGGNKDVRTAHTNTNLPQIQQAKKGSMSDEAPSSEARGRGEGCECDCDASAADTDESKLTESSEQIVPQAESKDHPTVVEGADGVFQETKMRRRDEVKNETCDNPSHVVEPPAGTDSELTNLSTVPMTMMEPSMPILQADVIDNTHTSSPGVEESPHFTSAQAQDWNREAKANTKSVQQLKCHRRAASTGSDIFHFESAVSGSGQASSSRSARASVAESIMDGDCTELVTKATKFEGMRSCFSADCLTQLDGGVALTPSEANPSASVQSNRRRSIADSCSSISDSEMSPKVQFLVEDTEISPDERTGQQEVISTPSGELSGEAADDDGQATQTEASTSGLSAKPHTLFRSQTEPTLHDKPPRPKAPQSPGGEIPREWASWKIADLHIPTTSWMGDPSGKKPIVFFIINYTLLKKPTVSDDSDVVYSSTTKQEVRRRYREFVNLHARINNNPLLRRHLKGLKNVPKQSVLPLARPGAAAEEQKRVSLESYLKQLLDRRMLHNSREMAEFLAIDGDAHIEFVKRPNQTPRIDKLLIRQVTGIVGQLKTALPDRQPKVIAPPAAPLHAAPPQSRSAKRQRAVQSLDRLDPITEKQKGLPALDQQLLSEDQWDLGVLDSSSDRLLGVDEVKESHIQRAMRLFVAEKHLELAQSAPLSPNLESEKTFLGPRSAGDGSDAPDVLPSEEAATKARGKLGAGNVALYQAVYGVLSEALLTQQSFILDKNMQRALQVGIGGLIDRWLENEIGLLFTEAQWGYYLSLLRELFWPGGVWHPKERESKSVDEMIQTKREALHELTHNAVSVALSLLIGEDDLTKGVSLVLDSLQDAELNKHLAFTFLDHAMDQLVPEISEPKFQALLDAMP